MRVVQRARNKSLAARCISKSRTAPGTTRKRRTTRRSSTSIEALFLGLPSQLSQPRLALGELGVLVVHEVTEIHTPVCTYHVVRKFSAFQQSDDIRARHVEKVGRLLGGQLGMNRHQAHGVA